MSVEQLRERKRILDESVRVLAAQIEQAQRNHIATLGAIELLGQLIEDELKNANNNTSADAPAISTDSESSGE